MVLKYIRLYSGMVIQSRFLAKWLGERVRVRVRVRVKFRARAREWTRFLFFFFLFLSFSCLTFF